jgi:hypothetical protein
MEWYILIPICLVLAFIGKSIGDKLFGGLDSTKCSSCLGTVSKEATKCKHCGSDISLSK